MIIITAKANTNPATGLPIVNYIVCQSMAEAGPYVGWMFEKGRTGGRRHHVKDLEELREQIKEHYKLDEFELISLKDDEKQTIRASTS